MEKYQPIFYEVQLRLQSHKKIKLNLYEIALKKLALKKGFSFCSIKLPIGIQKFNVLRSPHVNKKAKEHYQLHLYRRLLIVSNIKKEDLENFVFFEKFHQSFTEDIAMKISSVISLKCD